MCTRSRKLKFIFVWFSLFIVVLGFCVKAWLRLGWFHCVLHCLLNYGVIVLSCNAVGDHADDSELGTALMLKKPCGNLIILDRGTK